MSRKKLFLILFCIVTALLIGGAVFVLSYYRVRKVYVEGSTQYTDKEIADIVMQGTLGDNSLYLSYKYKDRGIDNVAFIDKMDVDIVDHETIRIRVYEKALAGYIEYVGQYIYFTRDGIVAEASREKIEGIPEVRGLSLDRIVLYERLDVDDDRIFDRVLDVTQLLGKYNLTVDKIYFDSAKNMTLFFGKVRVLLGGEEYTDEKIANLQDIIPRLEGKEGSIDMTGYTPDTRYTTFKEVRRGEEASSAE
ncbi:MAG: cell division protein FtsQ [Lachnospiraceae bacterium]|nr:cell division protein FtsQ [Lachnospiraceae bacterium]